MEIIKRDGSLIIDYNNFSNEDVVEENGKLIKSALEEGPYENIIIDLRDNRGGYVTGWHHIVEMLSSVDIKTDGYLLSRGKESHIFYDNISDFREVSLVNELENGDRVYRFSETIEGKKEINYEPSVYVLINYGSQSSSLMFAQLCKDEGFATILSRYPAVGGNGLWTSNYCVVNHRLPNSNLIIQYYSSIKCDKEGNPSDPTIEVDYIIDNGAGYGKVLDIIKRIK